MIDVVRRMPHRAALERAMQHKHRLGMGLGMGRGGSRDNSLAVRQGATFTADGSLLYALPVIQTASATAEASDGAGDTPLTLVTSVTNVLWIRADLAASGALWEDQGANNFDFTGVVNPTLEAAGGPNGQACMTATGTQYMTTTWNPPAPGTTPIWIWAVVKAASNTSSFCFFGGQTGATMALTQGGGSNYSQRNTTSANTVALANGTWARAELYFSASTSDYLKLRSTTATGTSAGGVDPTGWALFGSTAGTSLINGSIAEVAIFQGLPTTTERANLDTYCTNRYGSGLV